MATKQASRLRSRGFLVLLAVVGLTFATLYSPQPLLSTIQQSYPQFSGATIALFMTMAMAPLGFAPLIYGSVLSSLDARRVLQVCLSIMALAGLGLWYSTSFASLLFFRLIQGLIIPAVLTCLMAHIAAKFHGAPLQRALAIYVGMSILGGLVGRLFAGVMGTWWHWQDLFLWVSVALGFALLSLQYLRSKPARREHRPVSWCEFYHIMRTPGMVNLFIVDACGIFIYAAIASYLPFQLAQMGGMSEWHISLMYMGNVVGIAVAFNARRIAACVGGEGRAVIIGMVLYLCAMPGLLAGHALGIFLTMCCTCFGQFLAHSITPGLVNRLSDKDKGAVNGLYLSVYYTGGALGSYVPGLIYARWGWSGLIFSLCGLLLVALCAALGLQKHVHRENS